MNNTNEQIQETRKYLYGHNSKETAYVVDDYPWGFRLRTTIRYWVETKRSKNGGQRFGRQTINPKTGAWCAPKYSTYSPIIIMYLDEKDHIQTTCIGHNSGQERMDNFKEIHWNNLDDFQKDKMREIFAYEEVMKHVTFKVTPCAIGPVSLFSNDAVEVEKRKQMLEYQEARKKEQDSANNQINNAIFNRYKKNQNEMI